MGLNLDTLNFGFDSRVQCLAKDIASSRECHLIKPWNRSCTTNGKSILKQGDCFVQSMKVSDCIIVASLSELFLQFNLSRQNLYSSTVRATCINPDY